jgi:S-adenosylmethionine:tRNA ribosyltransferase-isomerase
MHASDFNFDLPEELIAQQALSARDQSRLLVLNRSTSEIAHRKFKDLGDYLQEDDVLVLNNSKVIRARLRGANPASGGKFELLLVEERAPNDWWTMIKPGKRARIGTEICLLDRTGANTPILAHVDEINDEGHRRITFSGTRDIVGELDHLGEVPLPPYIHRAADKTDVGRYQTVFARTPGSVAAPTAGLHFTDGTLDQLRSRGLQVCEVTLHVGLGTFAPVKADRLEAHIMHEERYEIAPEVADTLNTARADGRRILAVGTTALRTLEAAHTPAGIQPGAARTRLFAYPPFKFHAVDLLLTNFHLPRSTLLMLVSAFAAPGTTRGRDLILNAYAEAVHERYRFFSYGDAMLIV